MGEAVDSSRNGVNKKKRLWSEDEDNTLLEYVNKYGDHSWSNCQKITGLSRTGKSCRLRWTDQLQPGLKKQPFTPDEEILIADLQSQVGNKWTIIAEYFPGRTDNQIKNYWYNRTKKYKMSGSPHEQGASSDDSDTMNVVTELDLSPTARNSVSPLQLQPELTSIQPMDTPQGLWDNSDLQLFGLKPFDLIGNSPSQLQGELRSKAPGFSTSACFMNGTYGPPPCNIQQKGLVNPIPSSGPTNTDSGLIVEQSAANAITEQDDGGLMESLLTEGDIAEIWLILSNPDGSHFEVAASANNESAQDNKSIIPAWVNSPSLDEYFEQHPFGTDPVISANGVAIYNVAAATEEPTNCLNSFIPNDNLGQETVPQANSSANNLGQESVSQANGGAKSAPMIDVAAIVDNSPYWLNSPTLEGFLNEGPGCLQTVTCADYAIIDYSPVEPTSSVTDYTWDEASDFWTTPYFSRTPEL